MSHPNTDTDERVSTAPERYWLIPSNWGFIPSTTKPTKSEGIEYERADIAATRMRDRCVDAIKTLRATPHGLAYNNAINDAIHKVESLTLEGEDSNAPQTS